MQAPPATDTFKPIAHATLIDELEGSLAFRHIKIARDEYVVSPDGMRLFGLLELNAEYEGVRFAIGLRNANDKSMHLGMVAGYRVFVCDNMALSGDFKPLLAKHTKHLDLVESLSVGVDRIQRGSSQYGKRFRSSAGVSSAMMKRAPRSIERSWSLGSRSGF